MEIITPHPPQEVIQINNSNSPAGNLARYEKNWHSVTKNSFILNIIKFGYKIQLNSSNINICPVNSDRSNIDKRNALKNEIENHLSSGVISEVEFDDSDVVSRIFTVPKSSGGNRMIIDLSLLNLYINKVSFRMEDKNIIKSLINENDYLVSIDLKDAFHSISLHPESRKLTVFEFEGKRYSYNVLPFGLTSSPRIFTKNLKPVISFLRNSGIKITHYLDDILICADSSEKCLSHLNKSLSLLTSLGFVINYKKSILVPSQRILHLGYLWDSVTMTKSLPADKLAKIKKMVKKCSSNPCSIRTHAALLGLLVSSSNGFKFAALHYRFFQLSILKALKVNNSWDAIWSLHENVISELNWWSTISLQDLPPVSLLDPVPVLTIFTDASMKGWGSSLSSGDFTSGKWNSDDSKEHINYLELKAIYLTIIHFLPILKGKCISFRCDNTPAVYYFNKIGGTRSPKLCLLAIEIWKIFESNSMNCSASHISGIDNNVADFFSRHSHNHEYSLSQYAFNSLSSLIPFHLDIDIFASKDNKKLPSYVSLFNDSESLCIDAFSLIWPSNIYVFPPIPLISKALLKIQRDEVEFCIFITPAWHHLPILPLLKKFLIFNPIFIKSTHLLGYLPTRHPFHLMAWPISASFARMRELHPKFPMLSSRALALQPSSHIPGCGQTLLDGLVRENILPLCLPI